MTSLYTIVKFRELTPSDFYIGSRTPTLLKTRDCSLLLFYLPKQEESLAMLEVWAELAATIAGINFLIVNASEQRKIIQAFNETGRNPDHPLYPFNVNTYPLIMVYRDGWPQAFYNGELSFDQLEQFCLTLACRAGYYEPTSIYIGTATTVPEEDIGLGVLSEGRQTIYTTISSSADFGGPTPPEEAQPEYLEEGEEQLRETQEYRDIIYRTQQGSIVIEEELPEAPLEEEAPMEG